ncbi:hypothetical protein BMS3Abin01_00213 [bacterium BMS3Abin01]|nr:hypothetical protein BMS3Abin01_00213 [bacterium BMS3Abin01]
MSETLIRVLPLVLGAAISPSGILLVMGILSRGGGENQRRKAFSFLVGSTVFLVIVAMVILFLIKPVVPSAVHHGKLSGVIDIVLGGLIALVVVWSAIFKRAKAKRKKRKIPYAAVGFSFMLLNTSTLVLFVAACKIVVEGRLGLPETISLFLVLIAVTLSLMAFPVMISYTMPRQSERILGPITSFMSRYGNQVARVYFLLMAAYLAVHGVLILRG